MKLANVVHNDRNYLASVDGDKLALTDRWTSLDDFLESGDSRRALEEALVGASHVDSTTASIRPALVRPGKIICIGLNYRRHAVETGAANPTVPVVFSKFSDTVAAHGEAIQIPRGTSQLDYEVELAIVMGREAYGICEEQALDYVFGYANANDLSARDLQTRTSQWLLGKTCPQFSPIGPFVRTADEVPDPQTLSLKTCRNGVVVQDSNTADMIFSCREIIAYLTRYVVLKPGDIILTGTPEGVILGRPEGEQDWLRPGEEVVVEIEGLGQLKNTFVEESRQR